MTRSLPLAFRLVEQGAKLHPIEIIPVYACAFWYTTLKGSGDWGTALVDLATTNAILQLILFVVVVQIPAYVTGRMSNVDIAWPTGLVLLAAQALYYAETTTTTNNNGSDDGGNGNGYERFHHRAYLIGIALLLHGGRMAVGAAVMFFPFDWPNGDLPRYQYAKARWSTETAAENLWWLKQQHDTIMQAYANSVYIAAPILLVVSNPNPSPLRPMEIAGFGCWLISWILENISDIQMRVFVRRETRKNGDTKTAIIGYAPYNGWRHCMWTKSRHPNYFFEWMCWNSFLLMAIPSALDLVAIDTTSLVSRVGIFILFFYTSRCLYDCLLYWTGAEPAESRSVKRRPLYKRYQEITNVFFPFSVPFFNHHRTPGWPILLEVEEKKTK